MLTTQKETFLALLAFYSRQQIRISDPGWVQTRKLVKEGLLPLEPEFFNELVEWRPLQDKPHGDWIKESNHLLRLQERGINFWLIDESCPMITSIKDPPRCLTWIGDLSALISTKKLAIVGSREADADLLTWVDRELSLAIQQMPDLVVVSGGARGVDHRAHLTCIRHKAQTVLFLPSGLNCHYPQSNLSWLPYLLESKGIVVSEYHPDEFMKKWYFHQRNRLIAGVSHAVWIPQVQIKSGSWLTASLAAEAGRPVLANPALPWLPQYSGNLKLLEEGALWCTGYRDLLNVMQSDNYR